MLDSKTEVFIDAKGFACEGDHQDLEYENAGHYDQEDGVLGDAAEDVELSQWKGTSSCSLRALMKLNTCIITNTLNRKVKCLE